MLRILSLALVLASGVVYAQAPADVAADHHAVASPRADALPLRDAARDTALRRVEAQLACACYEAGDFRLDLTRGARAAECACPFAARMRADLESSLSGVPTQQLLDKRVVAEQVELKFVALAPEYERVFRYPRERLDWFMKNVRCVCDGCKNTIFFAKCGLTCSPAIVYKRRAKVFLALGFTTDELLAYYLADVNAHRPQGEHITPDYLLPGTQRETGWLVPATAIGAAALLLLGLVRRWSRRKPAGANAMDAAQPEVSDAAKRQVAAALDDDPEW